MALSVPMVSSTTVDDDGSVGKRTRKGRTKTDAQAGKVRYKLFLLIVEYNFKISVKNRPKMSPFLIKIETACFIPYWHSSLVNIVMHEPKN